MLVGGNFWSSPSIWMLRTGAATIGSALTLGHAGAASQQDCGGAVTAQPYIWEKGSTKEFVITWPSHMMIGQDCSLEHGPVCPQLCLLEQTEHGSNLILMGKHMPSLLIYICAELTSMTEFSKAVQPGQIPEQSANRRGCKRLLTSWKDALTLKKQIILLLLLHCGTQNCWRWNNSAFWPNPAPVLTLPIMPTG